MEKNKENKETFWEQYSKVVEKAWKDESFKKQLLENPNDVFQKNGISVPEGITVNIIEDSENVRNFPLPVAPKTKELANEQNSPVVGSSWFCCHTWSSEETAHG